MKEFYNNIMIEVLKTNNVEVDKDFVEIRIAGEDAMNFLKKKGVLVVEVFGKEDKVFELPINILKEAIRAAEESIED
jgi:hypothetical protein